MGVSVSGFIMTPPATGMMMMTFAWPLIHLLKIDEHITDRGNNWNKAGFIVYKGSMYVYLLAFGLFCVCTANYFPGGHNAFLGITFVAGGVHYLLIMHHCHT